MASTRDHQIIGPQLDTGIGSPVSPRADVWAYEGPSTSPTSDDTGVGSPLALRPNIPGSGDAFIPPLWL